MRDSATALEQATATNEKAWGKIAEVLAWTKHPRFYAGDREFRLGYEQAADEVGAILHEALPSDYQESKV